MKTTPGRDEQGFGWGRLTSRDTSVSEDGYRQENHAAASDEFVGNSPVNPSLCKEERKAGDREYQSHPIRIGIDPPEMLMLLMTDHKYRNDRRNTWPAPFHADKKANFI
jgi:hypothetical protein